MTSKRYSRYDHPDVLVKYTYFEGNVNMSMDKPIALNSTEVTRDLQVKAAKLRSPGLGNQNMNMSMDKPVALRSTEGTRDPQVKNAKMRSPGLGA